MDQERVTEILASAAAAVDAADVPTELREGAFSAAVRLLAGEQSPGPGQGAPAPPTDPAPPPDGGVGTGSDLLDRVASGLELGPEVVRLYAEKNGAPELKVKASDLPAGKSAGAQDIALLVMVGRQLAGVEEYTEAGVLWDACRRYGKYDSANFATTMKRLDHLMVTDGKGGSAKRKLIQPGIEDAAKLAAKYLGGGEG